MREKNRAHADEDIRKKLTNRQNPTQLSTTLSKTMASTPTGNSQPLSHGFYIVNRYDRPNEKHIAELRNDGLMYYIHPDLIHDRRYWAMNPDDPTPLEDFGIRILIEGGELHGKLVDPSRATYLDGRVRKWQGDDKFSFDYPNAQVEARRK